MVPARCGLFQGVTVGEPGSVVYLPLHPKRKRSFTQKPVQALRSHAQAAGQEIGLDSRRLLSLGRDARFLTACRRSGQISARYGALSPPGTASALRLQHEERCWTGNTRCLISVVHKASPERRRRRNEYLISRCGNPIGLIWPRRSVTD